MLKVVSFLCLVLLPGSLWAQGTGGSANVTTTISAPQVFNNADVQTLCSAVETDEVEITLTGLLTGFTTVHAYVWWEDDLDSNCTGKEIPEGDSLITDKSFELPPSSITFPEDFDTSFEELDLLNQLNACDETVLASEMLQICIGIDTQNNTTTGTGNKTIEDTEDHVWIEFEIDTAPPPRAVITELTEMDGAFEIDVATLESDASFESEDITTWVFYSREAPEGVETGPTDAPEEESCTKWPDKREHTLSGDATATLTLKGFENGVAYEICALAKDNVENAGAASQSWVGIPRDECDFFECYPGELETGVCAAGGSATLLWCLTLLPLVRRRRRRP